MSGAMGLTAAQSLPAATVPVVRRQGQAAPETPVAAPTPQAPLDSAALAPQGSANACLSLDVAPPPDRYQAPPAEVQREFATHFGGRLLDPAQGRALAARVLQAVGADGGADAIRALQERIGALPDGKFGPETWGKAIQRFHEAFVDNPNDAGAIAALTELIPTPCQVP